ncbi:MAG: tripartite tricarboxylate transporter substrate-binding protein [Pseudomonadota bacterium]
MKRWISNIAAATAACALIVICTTAAAAFPEKSIRIIVPYGVGGPADLCVRGVAEAMYANLGQPIIIENISGATGNIGLERVANAAPDGYTIAQASAASTANLMARPKASFDIVSGLKPIGKVCVASFTLAVAPALGVKTVEEFIRYAKANPGKLSYGSIGYGSSQHLVAEMFAAMTGLDILHVPFRGEAAVAAEIASGRIHMMFMAGAKPFIDGKLVAGLATTNRDTWPPIPSLPPIGKSALPGFSYNGWNGLMAPKGTPDAIVKRLSEALSRALTDEKVRAIIRTLGNDVGAGTPEDLAAQIRWDLSNFKRIIDERKLVFPE